MLRESPDKTSLLRQLWQIIRQTQTQTVFELKDQDLIEQFCLQLARQQPLSPQENLLVRNYLSSKIPLIRDLADDLL